MVTLDWDLDSALELVREMVLVMGHDQAPMEKLAQALSLIQVAMVVVQALPVLSLALAFILAQDG